MANELSLIPEGFPVSLNFALENAPANTANVLTLKGTNTGFVVPAGYKFQPIAILAMSNADLTAGTATFAVTDNGTVLKNGPTAKLEDTVQKKDGENPIGTEPIAAGHLVGVKATTDAGYLPITADLDAVLLGVLTPA